MECKPLKIMYMSYWNMFNKEFVHFSKLFNLLNSSCWITLCSIDLTFNLLLARLNLFSGHVMEHKIHSRRRHSVSLFCSRAARHAPWENYEFPTKTLAVKEGKKREEGGSGSPDASRWMARTHALFLPTRTALGSAVKFDLGVFHPRRLSERARGELEVGAGWGQSQWEIIHTLRLCSERGIFVPSLDLSTKLVILVA